MTDPADERAPQPTPSDTDVYAVYGVEPEVQAYAMAKYSRSALSMKESLAEISAQKAEKFLNTFYFQYGHRSIADLAHITFAIEKLSILAAIVLADEQRWDGQERSTRYQDFKKSGGYTPDFAGNQPAADLYRETIAFLFSEYEVFSEGMWRWLEQRTPCPDGMKQEAFERTLRARAFDVSRYLLPLATNTSLGQIVNARTLETQISRLLSSPYAEVRTLGQKLKSAAAGAAYNATHQSGRALVEKLRVIDATLAEEAAQLLTKEVRVSPTLVKYADPCDYEVRSRRELRQAAAELMKSAPIAKARLVDLLGDDPLELELATTLLYEHCHYPYRQIRERVEALGARRREEIIDLGLRSRGKHDEVARAFSAGQRFRFDILMDIGGFRDMHRHRRCIQIGQEFTPLHGYDTPEQLLEARLGDRYHSAVQRASSACEKLAAMLPATSSSNGSVAADDPKSAALYLLPLAFRKRTLFKMDF